MSFALLGEEGTMIHVFDSNTLNRQQQHTLFSLTGYYIYNFRKTIYSQFEVMLYIGETV